MAVLVLTQCARNFAYCSGQGRRGVCAVTLLLILSVCLAVDVPIHFCAASGSIDVSSKMRDRVSCFCILCKTVDSNSKNWTFWVRMNLPIWSSRLRVRKVYFWKKDVNFKRWNFILTFFCFFFGFPVQQPGVLTGLFFFEVFFQELTTASNPVSCESCCVVAAVFSWFHAYWLWLIAW